MTTRWRRATLDEGSTLIEALVATLVLTTGLLAMAQLVSAATASNASARSTTLAAILAEQKLEHLRSLTWGYDRSGSPISDTSTDTAIWPASPGGGTGLQLSPSTALQRNTPGFVDHVDINGGIVGRDAQAPPRAVYTRRWSIEAIGSGPDDALLIQVLVTRYRNRGRADEGSALRLPGDVRLATAKWRKRL